MMNATYDKTAEDVEAQASAWVRHTYRDPDGAYGMWQGRYDANCMERAYCAGFAAGLAHASNVFMSPSKACFTGTDDDPSFDDLDHPA